MTANVHAIILGIKMLLTGVGWIDYVDGFVGWVDTGIAWRYDWHQRTINRAYHFISIDRHFVSVTKKTIHADTYGIIMRLFVINHL